MHGPRTFLVLNLDRMQEMRRDAMKRMYGWNDVQLGLKQFCGPVVHQNPQEVDQICSVVYARLLNIGSPQLGEPAWSTVQQSTRPPFESSVEYFQMAQNWTFQHPDLSSPISGLVYLEFVAEYLGNNERGEISQLGWFAEHYRRTSISLT
jgi:hypothetical protein